MKVILKYISVLLALFVTPTMLFFTTAFILHIIDNYANYKHIQIRL